MKSLLSQRSFWAALIGLVVIVVAAFLPGFALDTEHMAGLAVVVVSYIVGYAINPAGESLAGMLTSRKFWAAVVGVAVIFMNAFNISLPAGLTPDQIIGVTLLFSGYIAGIGLEGPPAPLPEPGIDELE